MLRVQAQLTEDQARRLRELASEEGVSVAALLRRGADLVLEQAPLGTPEERPAALAAVGAFRSDADDVSRRHDAYLDEIYGS